MLTLSYRAYAIQRHHSITFRQIPGLGKPLSEDLINDSTHGVLSGMIVYNEKDAAAMMGLSILMQLFSTVDERSIDCWNSTCDASQGRCAKPDEQTVQSIYEILAQIDTRSLHKDYDRLNLDEPSEEMSAPRRMVARDCLITQYADILISQKWLQNRLWCMCLRHNLLKAQSPTPELRFGYAVSLAESTLDICKSLSLSSMEAHGTGFVSAMTSSILMCTSM